MGWRKVAGVKMVGASSMILFGVAALSFWAPACVCGQDLDQISDRVVREIDDGATGDRWLLVKEAANRGGPGRMVRVANLVGDARVGNSKGGTVNGQAQNIGRGAVNEEMHLVIRAGDALIVEEHSSVVDARLEATAMGSAAIGDEFEARPKIGGKVLQVVALARGRAQLVPKQKAQP